MFGAPEHPGRRALASRQSLQWHRRVPCRAAHQWINDQDYIIGYPFAMFDLGRRSANGWSLFKESRAPIYHQSVGLVRGTMNLLHEFFNRKLIQ
jgi:hypothetical protein